MNNKNEHLKVFGFGLALFIPFFIWMHIMKPIVGFWGFVLLLIAMLVVISQSVKRPWIYYMTTAGLLFSLFRLEAEHPLSGASVAFLIGALLLWLVSLLRIEWIRPIYNVWMGVATLIGHVITTVMMVFIFYLVFGIAGIILKIMRKDLLDMKIDPDKQSYWHLRVVEKFDRNRCTKQY